MTDTMDNLNRDQKNKSNLSTAFKELRKKGLIARQSFFCCDSCASLQIAIDGKNLLDAGKPPLGCVFYHKQANVRHDFYLSYGQIFHHGDDGEVTEIGEDTAMVGKLVVDVLTKYGIKTEWDGDPNKRIKVKVAVQPNGERT